MAVGEKEIQAGDFGRVAAEMSHALASAPMTGLMRELKLVAEEAIAVNFLDGKEAGGGAWAPRKRNYPWPTLIKTGHLMRSATTEQEPGHIEHIGDREMSTGTSVAYAGFHEYGTERMPARPFEAVPDSALDLMESFIVDYIQDAVFGGD